MKDFKRYNLIYGWNYSGKTTLSRAFQALERGVLGEGVAGGQFKFSFEGGDAVDQGNLVSMPSVRVFNRDYVKRNIATESTSSAVFIVGEEAIRLQTRVSRLESRGARLDSAAGQLRSAMRALEARRETTGSDLARSVANQTLDKSFNRTRLEELARGLPNPIQTILSEDELNAEIEYVRRAGDLVPQSISIDEPKRFVVIAAELSADFQSTPIYSVLHEFSEAIEIARWAEEGLSLHRDSTSCAFCSGELTANRMEQLEGHLSAAFRQLSTRLRAAEHALEACSLGVALPNPVHIAPECRADLSLLGTKVEQWDAMAVVLRSDMLIKINEKRSEPSTAFLFDGWRKGARLLESIEGLSRSIVERHNTIVAGQQARAGRASQRIREHWASVYLVQLERESVALKLKSAQSKLARLASLSGRCGSEVLQISKDVSGARRGAERVTEILGSVLGDTLLTVKPDGPSGFRFFRAGAQATNLSEGEQTAVTFSHFLASLESGEQAIHDLIVFVDDPISSLDSSNVYAVFGAIQRRLVSARQLFVSTHNSEFFSYLKSFWLHGRDHRNSSRAYLTRRVLLGDSIAESTFEALPESLERFGSEYEFIFSELFRFANAQDPALRDSYASANLLRRFLESYLGFRRPHPSAWGEKLDVLISDPVRASAVKKFCDDGSHLQARHRVFEHAVFASNAQVVVREVIDALKAFDAPHYASLCAGLKIEQAHPHLSVSPDQPSA
jgi:wobble nucleotide-excising tRNase